MIAPETAVLLLVEDLEDDILLIRKALEQADLPNPVYTVRDGEEAIAYLAGDGRHSNRKEYPLPDLILLDIKMPKLDGFQVLTWIANQPGIRAIPVVVLTSSEDLRDMARAYSLGAISFLVKPLDFHNPVELARVLKQYWQKSRLPQTYRDPSKT
jgi:CheY-like chemotaxis protein